MEPCELLEVLVAVVATLGDLVATVAGPDDDVLRVVPPKSLRAALRKFTWTLRCTLNHRGVTPLGQSDVTSLRQALATLEANPGAPWARERMTAAARAWQEPVAALTESWDRLAEEATELRDAWEDGNTLSAWSLHKAQRLLRRLAAACDKATAFPWELLRQLGAIEAALEGTKEASPNVPQALVTAVAEAERLWEASSRLTTCHLLGTLGDVHDLFLSPHDGPSGRAVAEQCQRAIEDIPGLLRAQQHPVIGAVTPSGTSLGSRILSSIPAQCLRKIWGIFWEFSLKLFQILMGIIGLTSLGTLGDTEEHLGTHRDDGARGE